MRVTEALLRQNNQKKKRRNPTEDGEETERYQPRSLERWSLNRTEAAFVSPLGEGLNTQESVFDRQAVFRTRS